MDHSGLTKRKEKVSVFLTSFSEWFTFCCFFHLVFLSLARENEVWGEDGEKRQNSKKTLSAEIQKTNQGCVFHMAAFLEEMNIKISRKGPNSTEKKRLGFFPFEKI